MADPPARARRRITVLCAVVASAALALAPLIVSTPAHAAAADGLIAGGTFRGADAPTPIADGTFVSNGGNVFRIAGGAPVHVSSWDGFGGEQPTTALSDAELAALPTTPANGTVLVGAQRGEVYVVAGGAPIFVSDWNGVGGVRQAVQVDDAAIDHAGEPGTWAHLRAMPADGTLVRSGPSGRVLAVVSGRAVGTESQGTAVVVDPSAIVNAGSGGVWNHLRAVPVSTPLPVPVVTTTPAPVASPSAAPTPVPTSTAPTAAPPVVAAPADPPAVLTRPTPTTLPMLQVNIRLHGHHVGHGWLCLVTTRLSPVVHHATSVSGCVRVATRGTTAITPRRPGTYYLVLIGRFRHLSPMHLAVTSAMVKAVRWAL